MATRRATGGLAHPTVVPENFDPDADESDANGDDAGEVGRRAGTEDGGSGERDAGGRRGERH
jgi:hypothetical protein